MNHSIQTIPFLNLSMAFIPVVAVMIILFKWFSDVKNALYAIGRMLLQLMLIGYFLSAIFKSDRAWIVVLVLVVMIFSASWISLRTVKAKRLKLYKNALLAITIGGGATLAIITKAVLQLGPWYRPQYMIPLAGMIFANSMNTVSLSAERLYAEIRRDVPYEKARRIAFQASLIPIVNSLFAVGLVSLPGMMTGQILSGVSPFIAARYQIMVMSMIFGAAGISSACFLMLCRSDLVRTDASDDDAPSER
jgi:putative ABC transport system permease protein